MMCFVIAIYVNIEMAKRMFFMNEDRYQNYYVYGYYGISAN